MKFAHVFLGLSLSLNALAVDDIPLRDKAIADLRAEQQKEYDAYKTAHPDWNKLPNEDHQKFFTDWSNKNLTDELKILDEHCQKEEKLCPSDKDKEAMAAETRVAIKVVELRNEYAKTKPTKAEQVKTNIEIERASNVVLCQEHQKKCDLLSPKDLDLVEKLKQRDARIAGMEIEFGSKNPDWEEKKKSSDVKDFKIRREAELLRLTLKLNDDLCHKYPKDIEFCLEDAKIEELRQDSARASCEFERIHQLYNITSDEVKDKEKILIAGHKSQWESLEKKSCKYLLAQDRIGETLTPAPVVVAPIKEEVLGENEDEKRKNLFDTKSCKWVTDIPRKLSYLPGCGSKGACVGLVVCDRIGGGKFVRTSTCATKLCGSGDAVKCTEQRGYYTKMPKDEPKEFVSEKLKRIFTGAIKQ